MRKSHKNDSSLWSERLLDQADAYRFRGDFNTIGIPAMLGTNEYTPAHFYSSLRDAVDLDGYLIAIGCGNAIAMVEAFSKVPEGIILVDVDPAVVCAGRMFINALAKFERVEDFLANFLAAGKSALETLEAEALAAPDPFDIARHMQAHRPRLWASLRWLTEDFSLKAEDVPGLIKKWQDYPADEDEIQIPVRTFVVRNYEALHRLAVENRFIVLHGSAFDASLLERIAELPHFAERNHVVYLSNAVDHLLRRALVVSAKSELRLTASEDLGQPTFPTVDGFVKHLNQDLMAPLKQLDEAAKTCTFVHSTSERKMLIGWQTSFPLFTVKDFNLRFDLRKMIFHFFEMSTQVPQLSSADGIEGWLRARRGLALDLYLAAILGDEERAIAGLKRVQEDWRDLHLGTPEGSWDLRAHHLPELCHALLLLEKGFAGSLQQTLNEIRQSLVEVARMIDARLADQPSDSVPTFDLLLASSARTLAQHFGVQPNDDSEPTGLPLQSMGKDGFFDPRGQIAAGIQAEALWRILIHDLHAPDADLSSPLAAGLAQLLSRIKPNGEIDLETGSEIVDLERIGVSARLHGLATDPALVYDSVRLALLFGGLRVEMTEAIETALKVGFYMQKSGLKGSGRSPSKAQQEAAPETAQLLEQLRQGA